MPPVESRLHMQAQLGGCLADRHAIHHAPRVCQKPVWRVQAGEGRAREAVERLGAALVLEPLPAALAAGALQILASAVRAFLDGISHLGFHDLRLDPLLAFGKSLFDGGEFGCRQLGYGCGQLADFSGFQELGFVVIACLCH